MATSTTEEGHLTKQQLTWSIEAEEDAIEKYRVEIRARERWIKASESSIAQLKEARDKAAC